MERFIRQHNDAVRQMLFPLHSNMERFILTPSSRSCLCVNYFSFQYGEIHTAVLPPFYAQIHLRRCCLCYNYAFDFQFFRKNQIFVCRSTGFLALLDIDRHHYMTVFSRKCLCQKGCILKGLLTHLLSLLHTL